MGQGTALAETSPILPGPTPTRFDAPLPRPTPIHGRETPPAPTAPSPRAPDDLHTPIVLTFDAPHAPPFISPALHITPTVAGQLTWRDDHTLVFMPFPGWSPDTRYQVQLSDGWRSHFRTERLLKAKTPIGNAADPRRPIAMHFGAPMDRVSVENAFTLSPTVTGAFRWTDDRRVVFEPDQALAYQTTYHVSFEGPLRDERGMPLPDVDGWSFTQDSPVIFTHSGPLVFARNGPGRRWRNPSTLSELHQLLEKTLERPALPQNISASVPSPETAPGREPHLPSPASYP